MGHRDGPASAHEQQSVLAGAQLTSTPGMDSGALWRRPAAACARRFVFVRTSDADGSRWKHSRFRGRSSPTSTRTTAAQLIGPGREPLLLAVAERHSG